MTTEGYVDVGDGWMYYRATGMEESGKPVILMIHGLGESGLCYNEAFEQNVGGRVVVPDLLGFGRSVPKPEADGSVESQVSRLWNLVDALDLGPLCLVGHSLGGDVGTLMAESDDQSPRRIRGFLNLEGNMTPSDTFISGEAYRADRCGDFEKWLRQDFMEETVFGKWAMERSSAQRYYASLHFCNPRFFSRHAQDAALMNLPRAGKIASSMGERYLELEGIQKTYCWGEQSIPQETLHFIEKEGVENRKFSGAGHWLMIDQAEQFYPFLAQFADRLEQ